jgi:capsular polysaccharide biosynthesis protein
MERVSTDIEAVTRLRDSTQRKLDGWKVLLANLGTTEDLQMLGPGKPEGTASSTATNTSADKKDKAALASDSERPPDSVIKGPNPDLQKDREELRGLKKRLDDARVNMKDEHPTVISLRKQIAELQERIASEPEVVPIQWVWNPARGSSTSSAAGGPVVDQNRVLRDAMFRQEITNATEELAHQNKDLEKLRERQASLTDLMNNLEVIRQNYAEVSKAVTAAVKEADGYQTQLAAIDQQLGAEIAKHGTLLNAMTFAEEQFTPSSPKLSYVLAFALLGGLAFGAGLVFLSNMMDRSISTTEEAAEYFGLPVYGVVGEIVTPRQRTTRKIRRLIVGPAVTLIVVVSLGCASLNIVLWLQYRNLHEGWKRAPVTFIASQVQAAFDNLKSRI